MAQGPEVEGDHEVVSKDVVLHRSMQGVVLEPKERPIDAATALPSSGACRGCGPEPQCARWHYHVALV
eukprot:1676321-Alexandrium_andersonii.AAC.1